MCELSYKLITPSLTRQDVFPVRPQLIIGAHDTPLAICTYVDGVFLVEFLLRGDSLAFSSYERMIHEILLHEAQWCPEITRKSD